MQKKQEKTDNNMPEEREKIARAPQQSDGVPSTGGVTWQSFLLKLL